MKTVTAIALAALGLAWGVGAPAGAQGIAVTTHAFGKCLSAPDRAVCLLEVLSARPNHSYRDRREFAGADPALMREIEGPAGAASSTDGSRSPIDVVERLPFQDMEAAVRVALEADRAGKPPDEALAAVRRAGEGLQSRTLLGGLIVTAGGDRLRAGAYESIWDAYRDPNAAADKRPSARLARAALDGWSQTDRSDHETPPGELGANARRRMEAYGGLGDEVGVRKEAETLDEPPAVRKMDILLALGKLDAAVAAAVALTPQEATSPAGRPDVRDRVLAAATKAGRTDLGRAVADAGVRDAMRSNSTLPACWFDDGPSGFATAPLCSQVEALAEWADGVARAGDDVHTMEAAVWAAEAWARIGREERAKALLAFYRPRAAPESACRFSPPCNRFGIKQIALWAGDYQTAAEMNVANLPREFIIFDVEHGRGLANVDAHLARSKNQAWSDQGLVDCADTAAYRRLWDVAKGCVDRLVARVDRPLTPNEVKLRAITTDSGRPRLSAIVAAWKVAGAAAKAGQSKVARQMTDLALRLSQTGDNDELPLVGVDFAIETVAIADLRARHRL